jgi:choline dehydrogenase
MQAMLRSALALVLVIECFLHTARGQAEDVVDFVIVGGGTAGCALAARLCEGLPGQQIVLLERGNPRNATEDLIVSAPRLAFDAWSSPNLMETFQSAPIPGLLGQNVTLRTGRTLGGTSAINGAHWTQPVSSDAAKWNITGLSAAEADRLFAKAAKTVGVATAPPGLRQTYVEQWLTAAAAANISRAPANEPIPIGLDQDRAWINTMTADPAGRRRDAATAYLNPVRAAGGACANNLQVVQSATVTKILINGSRATGVQWFSPVAGTAVRTLSARQEVIISAGPFGSPKLLQLSGIGPSALLAARGIPVVADLPVGSAVSHRPFSFLIHSYSALNAPENTRVYVYNDTTTAQFRAGQGGLLGVGISGADGVLVAENSLITHATAHPPPADDIQQFSSACFINPSSTGTVAISSTDPLLPPDVQPNLFTLPSETVQAVACINRHLKVCWLQACKQIQLQLTI